MDELPTVAEKVHTDILARNVLENKIPPGNFSSILGILKNNDIQTAKTQLLNQGLVSYEQLHKIFKNPSENDIIQAKEPGKLGTLNHHQ